MNPRLICNQEINIQSFNTRIIIVILLAIENYPYGLLMFAGQPSQQLLIIITLTNFPMSKQESSVQKLLLKMLLNSLKKQN